MIWNGVDRGATPKVVIGPPDLINAQSNFVQMFQLINLTEIGRLVECSYDFFAVLVTGLVV